MRFFVPIFIFCFLLDCDTIFAQVLQNLVRNPSFEQYKQVPDDLGQIDRISFCTSASMATPDFFHRRAANQMVDMPLNRMGNCVARSGYGYAGIYCYTNRYVKRNFREYIQLELKQSLQAGEVYCITFYVYLSPSSNRSIDRMNVSALAYQVNEDHESALDQKHLTVFAADSSFLKSSDWTRVQTDYVAKGGERYIIIGNFLDDAKTKVSGADPDLDFVNPNVDFAYYYLDDVCVTNLRTNFNCSCGPFDLASTQHQERIVLDVGVRKKNYRLGQVIVLKGLDFETGSTQLKSSSQPVLDDLIATLTIHPRYKIEIVGHTSDRGDAQKNQILSKFRAEVVYKYLISSGIGADRLSFKGFGESRPITLNTNREGKTVNERIEIKIIAI